MMTRGLIFPEITEPVIGAAIEVHRAMGPGLLEQIYEECLCEELDTNHFRLLRQPIYPIVYKGKRIRGVYRPDLIVDGKIIVEIKAVDKITDLHSAQVLTYLRITQIRFGLIFNFNTPVLRDGIRRLCL